MSDPLARIEPLADPEIQYQVPIRDWAEKERPSERVLSGRPDALSDAELIGVLFRSGTHTRSGSASAIQLGRTLLHTFGALRDLSRRDAREMMRVAGIGPAKAAQLAAAFEIGRRVEAQQIGRQEIQVCSPNDVASVYVPKLRDLRTEVFDLVLLNTANIVIAEVRLSEGGISSSIVEPRAVFQQAVLGNAASVICVHNHPSGSPEPSQEDIRITRQLASAGNIMGIPIYDHLIVAGNGYVSMAERQLL